MTICSHICHNFVQFHKAAIHFILDLDDSLYTTIIYGFQNVFWRHLFFLLLNHKSLWKCQVPHPVISNGYCHLHLLTLRSRLFKVHNCKALFKSAGNFIIPSKQKTRQYFSIFNVISIQQSKQFGPLTESSTNHLNNNKKI